jgi:murein DD-endopeptidase MepM/ murein hydrolase activator NlpD
LTSFQNTWKAKSKLTIHPFKALHSRTLLPLSIKDYAARFSMELIVLSVAVFAAFINFSIANHANLLQTRDESVIFSYVKDNPGLNSALYTRSNTTTILAKTDQWVTSALSQSPFSGIVLASASINGHSINATTIQENVILKTNPADTNNYSRTGRQEYEVVPGDTISTIAASFSISPQTVMLENGLNENSLLKPGQKLTILATTGVSHKILPGESISSIAAKYKISEDDLMDVNDIELPDDVFAGEVLVIPLAKVELPKTATPRFVTDTSNQIALRTSSAPSGIAGSIKFIWPTATTNITQGYHSRHAGIDISNSKMVAIYASADGYVELTGYQGGYGNTVIINHGSGFKTLYGHASEIYVKAGDKVAAGQVIAKQGRSGRVRGITGIHLHFEIIRNGIKVNPLLYVKP